MKVECQCGAVSFDTTTPASLSVYHCHCSHCRKQSSSAFGTSAIFPADGIFPLAPDLAAKLGCWSRPSNEGRSMDCYFCKTCGTRIMHRTIEPDGTPRKVVSIKGGIVEGLDWRGARHIFTDDAVVPIPDGVESFPGTPPVMEGRPAPPPIDGDKEA
ncbi:Mss4-like protein [Podospora didyma]|uniref:Mss4-like protein n=1 Tax=Podospora didyma TaxID=330526 RepID=A0AAE0NPD5_9PEZI|nr:Mss4-like protein [Podospora didyma]